MDEATVKALIEASLAPALKGAFQEFRGFFSEQLSPINERLSQFETATTPEPELSQPSGKGVESSSNPAMDALTARLAQMEKQEATRQEEVRSYKFQNELSSYVGKHDPMHGDIVKELLANRYGSKAVEKDGKYYTPSGTTLDEEVNSFFKSEVGSHFLKAPATTPSGTQKTNVPANGQKANPTVDDMLSDMAF